MLIASNLEGSLFFFFNRKIVYLVQAGPNLGYPALAFLSAGLQVCSSMPALLPILEIFLIPLSSF